MVVTSRGSLLPVHNHPLEHVVEISLNVARCIVLNHVHAHLILCVQYDVSELSKILTHDLRVVLVIKEYLLRESDKDFRVLKEFFD